MNVQEVSLDIKESLGYLVNECNPPNIQKYMDSFDEDTQSHKDFVTSMALYHIPGMKILQRRKQKNSKVLYIACAFGVGVALVKELGYDVKGIDINESYVQECTTRGLDVSVGDACSILFPDESFDVTISKDFLRWDYIDYDTIIKSLVEQHRVLKDEGVAIAYSISLGDSAKDGRLHAEKLESLPFDALKRYTLNIGELVCFVDVFEK